MALITLLYRFILIVILELLFSTFSYCQTNEFDKFIGDDKARALHDAVFAFDSFLEMNYGFKANYSASATAFLHDFMNGNTENWKLNSNDLKGLLTDFEQTGLRQEIWIFSNEIDPSPDSINDYHANLLYAESIYYNNGGQRQFSPHLVDSIVRGGSYDEFKNDSTYFHEYLNMPPVEGYTLPQEKDSLQENCTVNRVVLPGIHKFSNDPILWEYVLVKIQTCGIPRAKIAHAMLRYGDKVNYDSYLIKVMLVMEFYSDILYPLWLEQPLREE